MIKLYIKINKNNNNMRKINKIPAGENIIIIMIIIITIREKKREREKESNSLMAYMLKNTYILVLVQNHHQKDTITITTISLPLPFLSPSFSSPSLPITITIPSPPSSPPLPPHHFTLYLCLLWRGEERGRKGKEGGTAKARQWEVIKRGEGDVRGV